MIFKETIKTTVGVTFKRFFPKAFFNDRLTVFLYHDVSQNPSKFSKEYNLNVEPEIFESQIQFIKNNFNVISPDELLGSQLPLKAALITFDDGFKSFFYNAAPILEKYKVPSINFLNFATIEGKLSWAGLITFLCSEVDSFTTFIKDKLIIKKNVPIFLYCDKKIVNEYLESFDSDIKRLVNEFVGEFRGVNMYF